MPRPGPLDDSVWTGSSVSVGDGIVDAVGEGGMVVGVRVCVDGRVAVGGGVMRRSNFCPSRITESVVNPFHVISSVNETSYTPAMPESVSPIWIV